MAKWTENINGEPDTSRGVSPVRGRVLGNTTIAIWQGAGCLAYIVSTIIKNDGTPIETHNIGKNFSEPARKEIERAFGLVAADRHKQKEVFELKPVNAQKIQYGKSETLRAITNVLDAVLFSYKYTSLSELNAVLKGYNVVADPGADGSRVQITKGLMYRILDEKGEKVGVPIKASKIYCNPGLKFLEEKFQKNEVLRKQFRQRVKNNIGLILSKRTVTTIEEFQKALQREKIQLVLRQNKDGRLYGVTFIDHQSKSVFNGSDLQYSAAMIQDRLLKPIEQIANEVQKQEQLQAILPAHKKQLQKAAQTDKTKQQRLHFSTGADGDSSKLQTDTGDELLKELIKSEYIDSVPSELLRKKKRKRKRLHL